MGALTSINVLKLMHPALSRHFKHNNYNETMEMSAIWPRNVQWCRFGSMSLRVASSTISLPRA